MDTEVSGALKADKAFLESSVTVACRPSERKGFGDYKSVKKEIEKKVAEEVELHESTVSRVTTNKFLLTPRGLFELKYFFSSHVGTTSGGEASSTAIRAKIKN